MIVTQKTFCRFCHAFCGMEVDVDPARNRIVAVRGDPDNAVTRGYTCMKGRAELERIYHPDRLLASLKQEDGRRVTIASERALDEIAEKVRTIADRHGHRSVAVYAGCGAHRSSAGGPWFLARWLEALGSPSLYTSFTIDSPSLLVSYLRLFGGVVAVNLFDIHRADVAMFVGTNPVVSHMPTLPQSNPFKRLKDAQKRGMKLIVVDPRRCEVARRADVHLQVKPGEDATLLAGMVRVLIERGLYDREYVARYVSGVEALHEAVKPFDARYVERRTGVPDGALQEAVEMLAGARRGGAISGTGLHMARHQNLSTQLVMTLNALCGRYDRPGGLVRNEGPLGFEIPEGMGPVPIPLYTGEVSRVRGIRGTISFLGFYPEMPTNTLTDEILTPGDGQIRALFVVGGNPALVLPDEAATVRALRNLDLLVVSDLFLSATARFAHYVLAVKHPFERADLPRMMDFAYPFPFGQYSPALVAAPEGVLEDWEVFWGLAKRLNIQLRDIDTRRKPTADQILEALHAASRIRLDEVRKHPGGHVWGPRELKQGRVIPDMIGHADRRMAAGHPEVIAELAQVRAEPAIDTGGYAPGERFAFRLITYRMREVYCTQGQNLPSLRARRPWNPVLMNPGDMASMGLRDGNAVQVESGHGRLAGTVEATEDLKPGVVALAFGWGDPSIPPSAPENGCNVQRLIPDDRLYDPVTGLALQSAVPVNVTGIP